MPRGVQTFSRLLGELQFSQSSLLSFHHQYKMPSEKYVISHRVTLNVLPEFLFLVLYIFVNAFFSEHLQLKFLFKIKINLKIGEGKAILLQAFDRLLRFQEVEAPRISRQSALEGGKVVSNRHWPSLPPGRIPGTHFC